MFTLKLIPVGRTIISPSILILKQFPRSQEQVALTLSYYASGLTGLGQVTQKIFAVAQNLQVSVTTETLTVLASSPA